MTSVKIIDQRTLLFPNGNRTILDRDYRRFWIEGGEVLIEYAAPCARTRVVGCNGESGIVRWSINYDDAVPVALDSTRTHVRLPEVVIEIGDPIRRVLQEGRYLVVLAIPAGRVLVGGLRGFDTSGVPVWTVPGDFFNVSEGEGAGTFTSHASSAARLHDIATGTVLRISQDR